MQIVAAVWLNIVQVDSFCLHNLFEISFCFYLDGYVLKD